MSSTDTYSYDLISCNPLLYPNITNHCHAVTPSPFNGLIVYITGQPQAETYHVTNEQLNTVLCAGNLQPLAASNLTSCADPDADKIYKIVDCKDFKNVRTVKLAVAYVGPTVLVFVGECSCWRIVELYSTYTETPTVSQAFTDCETCIGAITGNIVPYEELTLSHAIRITPIQPEPPGRGLEECCTTNYVFGDVGDNDPYKNDFKSVYYQRQSDTDTVTFELVGSSTGVTALVDGTHGVLWDFDPSHTNPDLTYFKVEWRKILTTLGLGMDTYFIRMNISVSNLPPVPVNTVFFVLRPFSVDLANGTTRLDCKMNGTLRKTGENFIDSGYESTLRLRGYFGHPKDNLTQDTIIYGQKNGQFYYEDVISSQNDPEYFYEADVLHECILRPLREFYYFANELFISDYNIKNPDYRFRLFAVILDGVDQPIYHQGSRKASMRLTFKDRQKNKGKDNC